MLRMRKKPPADMPKINSGKDWSPMDMADLLDFHESGEPCTSAGRFPTAATRRQGEHIGPYVVPAIHSVH
jgi:hypothetical protein